MFLKFPSEFTKPIFFSLILSTLTLSACSDNDDDNNGVDTTEDTVAETIEDPVVPVVVEDPVVPVVVEDPVVPVVVEDPVVEVPVVPAMDDPDNDDRPGLVVTGLNGIPADQLTSPWLVNADLFRDPTADNQFNSAFVDLLRYDDTFQVSTHIDFYTPELDSCFFSDTDIEDSGEADNNDVNLFVSGGTSLTINAGNGPFLSISEDGFNPGRYSSNFNATPGTPGPLPADATLSIPGAEFPNVAAYPLSEPTLVPVRITPDPGTLTAAEIAAPFTWEPGPDVAGGYMRIQAQAFNAEGEFVGFPFACAVVDDGEFNMPQEAIDAFAATDRLITFRYERTLNRVDFIDGIVFHVRSLLAE